MSVIGSFSHAGTQLAVAPRSESTARPGRRNRVALWLGSALAAGAAWTAFPAPASTAAGEDLVRLLQSMALIKGTLVAMVLVALHWRLRRETPALATSCYVVSAWSMSLMVVCMWRLAHLGLVALAFHAVIVLLAMVAWRDADFIPRPAAD